MPKIRKVVSTVWYNKENYHALRNVFPEADFVYVNFYDKEKLAQEAKDADVAILLGDVDDCLLGQNTLKWVACDHAGLNGSARDEVLRKISLSPVPRAEALRFLRSTRSISCCSTAIMRRNC